MNHPAEILGEIFPKVSIGVILWIALYFYEYSEAIFELQEHLIVSNFLSSDSWVFMFVEVRFNQINILIELLGDNILNIQPVLFKIDHNISERKARFKVPALHYNLHNLVSKLINPTFFNLALRRTLSTLI